MFSDHQKTALSAPLARGNVKTREQAGRTLSYVEGWLAIAEANRIFGFDGWASETVDLRCVSERERKIGKEPKQRDGWGVSYTAKVRVTVFAGDTIVTREGVGAGHGIDVDLGLAHESAIKEAETDGRKRALMTFGNPFGLALYDKDQENVSDEGGEARDAMMAKAQFLADARLYIQNETDIDKLKDWWISQAKARREAGLENADVDPLKTMVMAKLQGKAA